MSFACARSYQYVTAVGAMDMYDGLQVRRGGHMAAGAAHMQRSSLIVSFVTETDEYIYFEQRKLGDGLQVRRGAADCASRLAGAASQVTWPLRQLHSCCCSPHAA